MLKVMNYFAAETLSLFRCKSDAAVRYDSGITGRLGKRAGGTIKGTLYVL